MNQRESQHKKTSPRLMTTATTTTLMMKNDEKSCTHTHFICEQIFKKPDSISPSHITRFCSPVLYNRFSLSPIAFGKIHTANLFYAISKNGECVPKFKGLISSLSIHSNHIMQFAWMTANGCWYLRFIFFCIFMEKKSVNPTSTTKKERRWKKKYEKSIQTNIECE